MTRKEVPATTVHPQRPQHHDAHPPKAVSHPPAPLLLSPDQLQHTCPQHAVTEFLLACRDIWRRATPEADAGGEVDVTRILMQRLREQLQERRSLQAARRMKRAAAHVGRDAEDDIEFETGERVSHAAATGPVRSSGSGEGEALTSLATLRLCGLEDKDDDMDTDEDTDEDAVSTHSMSSLCYSTGAQGAVLRAALAADTVTACSMPDAEAGSASLEVGVEAAAETSAMTPETEDAAGEEAGLARVLTALAAFLQGGEWSAFQTRGGQLFQAFLRRVPGGRGVLRDVRHAHDGFLCDFGVLCAAPRGLAAAAAMRLPGPETLPASAVFRLMRTASLPGMRQGGTTPLGRCRHLFLGVAVSSHHVYVARRYDGKTGTAQPLLLPRNDAWSVKHGLVPVRLVRCADARLGTLLLAPFANEALCRTLALEVMAGTAPAGTLALMPAAELPYLGGRFPHAGAMARISTAAEALAASLPGAVFATAVFRQQLMPRMQWPEVAASFYHSEAWQKTARRDAEADVADALLRCLEAGPSMHAARGKAEDEEFCSDRTGSVAGLGKLLDEMASEREFSMTLESRESQMLAVFRELLASGGVYPRDLCTGAHASLAAGLQENCHGVPYPSPLLLAGLAHVYRDLVPPASWTPEERAVLQGVEALLRSQRQPPGPFWAPWVSRAYLQQALHEAMPQEAVHGGWGLPVPELRAQMDRGHCSITPLPHGGFHAVLSTYVAADNRATAALHGGVTQWLVDGATGVQMYSEPAHVLFTTPWLRRTGVGISRAEGVRAKWTPCQLDRCWRLDPGAGAVREFLVLRWGFLSIVFPAGTRVPRLRRHAATGRWSFDLSGCSTGGVGYERQATPSVTAEWRIAHDVPQDTLRIVYAEKEVLRLRASGCCSGNLPALRDALLDSEFRAAVLWAYGAVFDPLRCDTASMPGHRFLNGVLAAFSNATVSNTAVLLAYLYPMLLARCTVQECELIKVLHLEYMCREPCRGGWRLWRHAVDAGWRVADDGSVQWLSVASVLDRPEEWRLGKPEPIAEVLHAFWSCEGGGGVDEDRDAATVWTRMLRAALRERPQWLQQRWGKFAGKARLPSCIQLPQLLRLQRESLRYGVTCALQFTRDATGSTADTLTVLTSEAAGATASGVRGATVYATYPSGRKRQLRLWPDGRFRYVVEERDGALIQAPLTMYKGVYAVIDGKKHAAIAVLAVPQEARVDTGDYYKYRVSECRVVSIRLLTRVVSCCRCATLPHQANTMQWAWFKVRDDGEDKEGGGHGKGGKDMYCKACVAALRKKATKEGRRSPPPVFVAATLQELFPATAAAAFSPFAPVERSMCYKEGGIYRIPGFGAVRNESCGTGIHCFWEPEHVYEYVFDGLSDERAPRPAIVSSLAQHDAYTATMCQRRSAAAGGNKGGDESPATKRPFHGGGGGGGGGEGKGEGEVTAAEAEAAPLAQGMPPQPLPRTRRRCVHKLLRRRANCLPCTTAAGLREVLDAEGPHLEPALLDAYAEEEEEGRSYGALLQYGAHDVSSAIVADHASLHPPRLLDPLVRAADPAPGDASRMSLPGSCDTHVAVTAGEASAETSSTAHDRLALGASEARTATTAEPGLEPWRPSGRASNAVLPSHLVTAARQAWRAAAAAAAGGDVSVEDTEEAEVVEDAEDAPLLPASRAVPVFRRRQVAGTPVVSVPPHSLAGTAATKTKKKRSWLSRALRRVFGRRHDKYHAL